MYNLTLNSSIDLCNVLLIGKRFNGNNVLSRAPPPKYTLIHYLLVLILPQMVTNLIDNQSRDTIRFLCSLKRLGWCPHKTESTDLVSTHHCLPHQDRSPQTSYRRLL